MTGTEKDDVDAPQPGRTQRSTNISQVLHRVSQEERWRMLGHRSGIFWFTGLSGSGKSTLAMALERELHDRGINAYVLDGDNFRTSLAADLGFSLEDRAENIRRAGEVAIMMAEAGVAVIAAFISPYRSDRDSVRARAGARFNEIHLTASAEACELRDPKGLYRKARAGEIRQFTGVSAPYEQPESPELALDTAGASVEECVAQLLEFALSRLRP